jgi:NAD-reducing hydrogenase small subunit
MKKRLATVWLDGCSGCHMSLLDLDENLLAVAAKADVVYSPLVDAHEFPERVDIALVEGAISSQDDLKKVREIRSRTRVLVALGDCAVTSNVPSMRNSVPAFTLINSIYDDSVDAAHQAPSSDVPALLPQARPLHDFVEVDYHLPGCPPPAGTILAVVSDLLDGRKPKPPSVKFG